jgi:hypothetical protein
MIQRIQSLYLLLASAALSLMALAPLVTFTAEAGEKKEQLLFTLYRIDYQQLEPVALSASQDNKALAFLAYGIALIQLLNIFLYNNRPLQIRLARMGMLLSAALLFSIIVTAYRAGETLQAAEMDFQPGWTFFLPAMAFVLYFLAWRAIRKDDALVKSVDRIR